MWGLVHLLYFPKLSSDHNTSVPLLYNIHQNNACMLKKYLEKETLDGMFKSTLIHNFIQHIADSLLSGWSSNRSQNKERSWLVLTGIRTATQEQEDVLPWTGRHRSSSRVHSKQEIFDLKLVVLNWHLNIELWNLNNFLH